MFKKLREAFEEFISDKSEEERVLIKLRIECNYVIEKSRQSFSLYHEGNEERSIWFAFTENHSKKDFRECLQSQYKQLTDDVD